MSIHVPPPPSRDADPAVYERLAAYASEGSEERPQGGNRGSRLLLVASCALCLVGIVMLACAISVQCAPQSGLSQVIALVSRAALR